MTKNYCDRCSEEVVSSESVRISFWGNKNKHFLHKNYHFCEKCFTEIDNELIKFIPQKSSISKSVFA